MIKEKTMDTTPESKKPEASKITAFDLIRAASTIIVFGIPLIVGTTTIFGYGIYKVYKRLKG